MRNDVVQEVVIRCWELMEGGRWTIADDESLIRLVRSMTWRRVVDHKRSTRRRAVREAEHVRELEESTHAWVSPELTLEKRELEALHAGIMAEIPQTCLKAYAMVRGDDAQYKAVAARLGVSREAVSTASSRSGVVTIGTQRSSSQTAEAGLWLPPSALFGRQVQRSL